MDKNMREILLGFGFVAAGTTEVIKGAERPIAVGAPKTFGYNQGVIAVCDEQGAPWICPMQVFKRQIHVREGKHLWWLCQRLGLDLLRDRTAHVPHSNDGHVRVRTLFPQMYERRQDDDGCCGLGVGMCDGLCRSLDQSDRERREQGRRADEIWDF